MEKKGEETLSWLIGAIVGIMLASVFIAIGIQWYQTTTKTEDSFDALIANIEGLKDKEKKSMPYFLPEGYLLVSFTGGNDFIGEQGCQGTVEIPDFCGTAPCLCVCKGAWKASYQDTCVEAAVVCYPFTKDTTKDFSFYDSDCSPGVYKDGPNNGVMSLFLERDGNIIRICNSENCFNEEQQQMNEGLEILLTQYLSCQKKREDCSCPIDLDFLVKGYGIAWYANSVQIIDLQSKSIIEKRDVTTNSDVKDAPQFTDTILLYSFTEITVPEVEVAGISKTEKQTYPIISPYLTQTTSTGVFIPGNSLQIQEVFYKQENKMLFVESSTDLSTIPPCTTVKDTPEEVFPSV